MFNALNDAAMSAFAEPFVYKPLGPDVALQGIFDVKPSGETLAGAGFVDRVYTLSITQSMADAANIERMQAVTVRGVDYQIIDLQPDAAGIVVLTLRKY